MMVMSREEIISCSTLMMVNSMSRDVAVRVDCVVNSMSRNCWEYSLVIERRGQVVTRSAGELMDEPTCYW